MSDSIKARLAALRAEMAKRGIDLYVVSSADFHGSEYIGAYFKTREYLTGFTGSAGTAVILPDEAYLWTDGRYFIQAKRELSGSGISLMRMGEAGVPSVREFVQKRLPMGGCIGFDGRTVSAETGEAYRKAAMEKKGTLWMQGDLTEAFWTDRPKMPCASFFILSEQYSGKSTADKLADIRNEMKEAGADVHLLSSLCDIAWILNVRGNDITHVPVVLSYLAVTMRECIWFLREEMITKEQRAYLEENHVATRPYEAIDAYIASLNAGAVLYDGETLNMKLAASIPKGVQVILGHNPSERQKAVKNPVETEHIKRAHIKDGVAFTKFMYWLKTRVASEEITEISASEYLLKRRQEQEHFLDVSFDTICAYGEHAAMMHYAASKETNARLKPEGFLLVDSGGHYLEGTTDITRTFALGAVTKEMKRHFTAVVRGNLNLASAKFLQGVKGTQLDVLARKPIWDLGLDYRCGTGHGVGYLLNVHEGPNAFRYKQREGAEDLTVLKEGMVTTDEPGIYLEGAYGIRIENELLCQKAEETEYGQFLCFETITYAPIDLDAVDASELTEREKMQLNAYHQKVYKMLAPFLTEEEAEWLKGYTREL